ncbi:RhoGAP-domain-containing protein, partial [Nadsonia fulvescens var. elongata DSM 6958]
PSSNKLPSASPKIKKICFRCSDPISGQFVRALNQCWHMNCFTCYDCATPCSQKFFPVISDQNTAYTTLDQVPLCETCYFRRLDLLCHSCNGALRSSYITAIGHKYHVEHFTCSMCSTLFGVEDSYYEHQDSIYCLYHYSTLFATKCNGCCMPIIKQFVEIFRNGKQQQWHPECYMIHKFWNVRMADAKTQTDPVIQSIKQHRESLIEHSASSKALLLHKQQSIEDKIVKIWTSLCAFEESTAACISDMLQFSSSVQYSKALDATTRLTDKIQILFTALDGFTDNKICWFENFGPLETYYIGKEPKTLCKKLVNFMSLLSKAKETEFFPLFTRDLLSLVTSLAHYLKLLIRLGLNGALQWDFSANEPLHVFLDLVDKHRDSSTLSTLSISNSGFINGKTTDQCTLCSKSIETESIRHTLNYTKRWHMSCFNCHKCQKKLAKYMKQKNEYSYTEEIDSSSTEKTKLTPSPFIFVSKLDQFTYLLRIALERLQRHLTNASQNPSQSNQQYLQQNTQRIQGRQQSPSEPASSQLASQTVQLSSVQQNQELPEKQQQYQQQKQGYMTTLTDIRRLRSLRTDNKVSDSTRQAASGNNIVHMSESQEELVRPGNSRSASTNNNGGFDMGAAPSLSYQKPHLDRTTDLLTNDALTLDDIPRIVAAEEAREQRPNAFRHHDPTLKIDSGAPASRNYDHTMSDSSTISVGNVAGNSKVSMPQSKYISEMSAPDMFLLRHIAVVRLHEIVHDSFTMEELLSLIETRKAPSFWNKMGKAFGGDKGAVPTENLGATNSIFGASLEYLVEQYGVYSSLGMGPSKLKVPSFVDDCISAMRQMDMSVEGVFRKNGNIRRLKELTESINKNPESSSTVSSENPVQLAALFKKFLRELPDPLLTFKLQKLFLLSQKLDSYEDRLQVLHLSCILLPRAHRDSMEVIFFFLKWVASFSHIDKESGSKMDVHNLATVITPNILYARGGGSDYGDAYFLSIEAVNTLIDNNDEFSQVPNSLLLVL